MCPTNNNNKDNNNNNNNIIIIVLMLMLHLELEMISDISWDEVKQPGSRAANLHNKGQKSLPSTSLSAQAGWCPWCRDTTS